MSIEKFQYLYVDSTWRNRNIYPLQGNFVIPYKNQDNNFKQDPILDSYPQNYGTTATTITLGVSTTVVLQAGSWPLRNYFNNVWAKYYLNVGSEFRQITAYDLSTFTATFVSPFLNNYSVGTDWKIVKVVPYLFNQSVAAAASYNTTSAIISLTENLVGRYIIFTSGPNSTAFTNTLGEVGPAWSCITSQEQLTSTTSLIRFAAVPNVVNSGDTFDVSFATRGCEQGLSINSLTEKRRLVDIELVNIMIPGTSIINTAQGGTISAYPILYVTIQNTSMKNRTNIISSNASECSGATFVVPVTDISVPGSFLKLSKSFSSVTTQLSLNEDIEIIVKLPTGQVLQYTPDSPDGKMPLYVNQIFALFQVHVRS